MIDPSLLILALGVATSMYVGVSKLGGLQGLTATVMDRLGSVGDCCICLDNNNCIAGVQIANTECLDLARVELHRTLLESEYSSGLAVIVVRKDVSKLLKKIENMIATYDVILEAQPENKRIYMRKKILEDLLARMSTGLRPIEVAYIVIIRGNKLDCKRRAEEAKNILELHECRVRILCGRRLLAALMGLINGAITTSDMLETIASMKNDIPPEGDVYIGRIIGTNVPVFLKMSNCHTLVLGPTGSGKTTLLATIASRIAAFDTTSNLYVIDPKGDLTTALKELFDEISIYDAVNASTLPRQAVVKVVGEEHKRGEAVVSLLYKLVQQDGRKAIVVDEAWRATRELINSFVPLFKESRSRGASLILASQDPEDVPEEVWNNTCTLIAFGSHDEEYVAKIRRVVDVDDKTKRFLLHSDSGKAIIKMGRNRKPAHIVIEPPQIILKNLLHYTRD